MGKNSKNSPAKGHHGLAARGQGKLLYYHTQIPQAAARQAAEQKGQIPAKGKGKGMEAPERRQPGSGRWAE